MTSPTPPRLMSWKNCASRDLGASTLATSAGLRLRFSAARERISSSTQRNPSSWATLSAMVSAPVQMAREMQMALAGILQSPRWGRPHSGTECPGRPWPGMLRMAYSPPLGLLVEAGPEEVAQRHHRLRPGVEREDAQAGRHGGAIAQELPGAGRHRVLRRVAAPGRARWAP